MVTRLMRPSGPATKSFLFHEQDGLPGEEQRAFEDPDEATGGPAPTVHIVKKRPAARAKAGPRRACLKRPAGASTKRHPAEPDAPPNGHDAVDEDDEGRNQDAGVLRKPAQAPKRRTTHQQYCKGSGGEDCFFSLQDKGGPMITQKTGQTCMFCCSETRALKLKRASGKDVTHALKKLLALDETIFELAADRVRALGGEAVVNRAKIKRQNGPTALASATRAASSQPSTLDYRRSSIRRGTAASSAAPSATRTCSASG